MKNLVLSLFLVLAWTRLAYSAELPEPVPTEQINISGGGGSSVVTTVTIMTGTVISGSSNAWGNYVITLAGTSTAVNELHLSVADVSNGTSNFVLIQLATGATGSERTILTLQCGTVSVVGGDCASGGTLTDLSLPAGTQYQLRSSNNVGAVDTARFALTLWGP